MTKMSEIPLVGWREWVALPELGVAAIKAKIDTGARTSALHTFHQETYRHGGRERVRFKLHPVQRDRGRVVECEADVHDVRWVSDSGGHRERRIVILTPIRVGAVIWDMEITLTDRDTMQFRMLLGRSAISGRFMVDPQHSYMQGRPKHKKRTLR